jgi:hypothetical protein
MRILIWGIVALFGFGVCVEALAVRGSTDERAAIRRALRAPLADLRRRDARALCEDFTPEVDKRLARGGDCDRAVAALLHGTTAGGRYVPVVESAPAQRSTQWRITWRGDRATAVSLHAGDPAGGRRWRLQQLGGRWRIATTATLDRRTDCPPGASDARSCVYAVALRFAALAAPAGRLSHPASLIVTRPRPRPRRPTARASRRAPRRAA